MAARRKLETFTDYERALKNGYGKGVGSHYKPWIRVQDVPSHGNSAKIQGMKTERAHHLLSEQEACFFYLIEYCDSIVDIREQFPFFPLDFSVKIAQYLDIKHPKHPISKTYNVVTIDFMLTRTNGIKTWHEAVSVKPLCDFTEPRKKKRIAEKLDIERVWCELLDIPYHIFSMTPENKIESDNIQWLTSSIRRHELFGDDDLFYHATKRLSEGTYLLPKLYLDFEVNLHLNSNESMNLFKELVVNKWIYIDITKPIPESDVVNITKINKHRDKKSVG